MEIDDVELVIDPTDAADLPAYLLPDALARTVGRGKVEVRTGFQLGPDLEVWKVRLSLRVPGLAGVELRVRAGSRLFGILQDERVGDEGFDERYLVTGDPAMIRWLLDVEVRDAIAAAWDPLALRPCEAGIDDGEVWCASSLPRNRAGGTVFARMAAALRALASRPDVIGWRWAALATALDGEVEGDGFPPGPIRVRRPGGEVRIAAGVSRGRLRTEVRVEGAAPVVLDGEADLAAVLPAIDEVLLRAGRSPSGAPYR